MLSRWQHHLELVGALVGKEFRVRYRSSLLGVVWSLLNPICFALVLYAAFRPVLHVPTDDYVAFGSEYRALASLPGIEKAKVWEPKPATVYFWERH